MQVCLVKIICAKALRPECCGDFSRIQQGGCGAAGESKSAVGDEVGQVWGEAQVPSPGLPPPQPAWRLSSQQGLVTEALGKGLIQQSRLHPGAGET